MFLLVYHFPHLRNTFVRHPAFHLEVRHHFQVNKDRQNRILSIFNNENI